MQSIMQFVGQLAITFFITTCSGLIFNPAPTPLSSTGNPPIPQYRFHYYVRDENTGDFKSQEEHRTGDSVTGSYMVAEPNGDLRVVKYVADVSNGFKADVNVQPGASPMKSNPGNSKEGISYGNQRTGISAPPKQRKPLRGFNPIVVKSLSSFGQPLQQPSIKSDLSTTTSPSRSYMYYRENSEPTQNSSFEFTTTNLPQKSVQVELTYKDDSVIEKTGESAILPEKKLTESTSAEPITVSVENKNFNLQSLSYLSTEIPTSKTFTTQSSIHHPTSTSTNGLYQLDNMDIPSSIIEILNQQKSDFKNPLNKTPTHSTDITTASPMITESPIYKNTEDLTRTKNPVTTESELNIYQKINLPQRPMRLIGLSPIYMDHSQLQQMSDNLTSPSQLQLGSEHIVNIQYATPTPFISGPLLGGPAPFRNIPRSVPELSESSLPLPSNPTPNTLPVINSLPISAPIISSEVKQEIKPVPPPPASLPLCNDCLLPPNYMSYPVMRFPPASNNNNQKPCASENTPYWAPYKPGFAYILMPSQIIKNNL